MPFTVTADQIGSIPVPRKKRDSIAKNDEMVLRGCERNASDVAKSSPKAAKYD